MIMCKKNYLLKGEAIQIGLIFPPSMYKCKYFSFCIFYNVKKNTYFLLTIKRTFYACDTCDLISVLTLH